MENKGAIGKITQVISAVLDIKFPEGHLPEINDAIRIPLKKGGELIVEVAQHLGDDTVRCIALGPTDGLVRGKVETVTSVNFYSSLISKGLCVSVPCTINLHALRKLDMNPVIFMSGQPKGRCLLFLLSLLPGSIDAVMI